MTTFSRKEEIAYALGYRVSADGVVSNHRGMVLKPYIGTGTCQYPTISIGRNNGKIRVHRLQAFQKFGVAIYKTGIVVRHKDDNSLNFRADNLILGTHVENSLMTPSWARKALASVFPLMTKSLLGWGASTNEAYRT